MLSNRVSEIMTTNLTSATVASPIQEVLEMMVTADVGRVIVTNAGIPVGIFTEKDVLKRVVNEDIDPKKSPIKDVMTSPLVTMADTGLIGEALTEMYRRDIRNMPVMGTGGNLIGIVSMPDILQYAAAFNIDEKVRQTWKEVQEYYDSEDQYTPG